MNIKMSVGNGQKVIKCSLEQSEGESTGQEESIVITEYVSPTKFSYITMKALEANGRIVCILETKLRAHCHDGNQKKNYNNSDLVIVRYHLWESVKYLRGKVMYKQWPNIYVLAFDYGFVFICRCKDLWLLPESLNFAHMDINVGGLSGVASFADREWSKEAKILLYKSLEKASALIFTIECRYNQQHNYGKLLIKADNSLLDAASYLIENNYARRDIKLMNTINYEALSDGMVDINEAGNKPNPFIARVMHLMDSQLIKLGWSTNAIVDQQLTSICYDKQQFRNSKRILKSPAVQQEKINRCCRLYDTIKPDTARLLSLAKNRTEGSSAKALSTSSSSSLNGSNSSCSFSTCSSASLDIPKLPTKHEARNSRSILELYRQPMAKPQITTKLRENAKQECMIPLKNMTASPTMPDLKTLRHREMAKQPCSTPINKLIGSPTIPDVDIIRQREMAKQRSLIPAQKVARSGPGLDVEKPQQKISIQQLLLAHYREEVLPLCGSSKSLLSSEVANAIPDAEILKQRENAKMARSVPRQDEARPQQDIPKPRAREQVLLAHYREEVLPWCGSSKSLFSPEVAKAMQSLDMLKPLDMQSYAWPHLMKSNTMVLIDRIGSGRSWSYLPTLCSLVMRDMRESPAANLVPLGPLAVVLADSVPNARKLSDHCSYLMKHYETQMFKVVNTHDHSVEDVQLMLLNSCGILITTMSHWNRLLLDTELSLIDSRRLKHFVLDDYDRLLSTVPDLLNESLKLLESLSLPQLQLILIAQQWHDGIFQRLTKRFGQNHILLFGDFLEAAMYGKLKLDVNLLLSRKKTQQLIDYLTLPVNTRTVIYCKQKELCGLKRALIAAGHECIGMRDAVHQKIHQLLLVCDSNEQQTQLPIKNFGLLVHYSLPATWSKFSNRFHVFLDTIDNCLEPQGKSQNIASFVLMDESNNEELLRLARFLVAHGIKLDKPMSQMVESCRQLIDQNSAFCPKMLSTGQCDFLLSCKKRHFPVDGDLRRPCSLWQPRTVVRCKIVTVYSPVHFAVMAESYKSNECESWQSVNGLTILRDLSAVLWEKMGQKELKMSEIYILQRGSSYQRVRVVDLSDKHLVIVKELDEGGDLIKVKPTDLLQCDSRLKKLDSVAMDVRLYGLKPSSSGEGDWLPEANQWVRKELSDLRNNQHLQLVVDFSMLDSVYVREIAVVQECPTLRTSVKVMQLPKELIQLKFGERHEQNIKSLQLMREHMFKDQQIESIPTQILEEETAENDLLGEETNGSDSLGEKTDESDSQEEEPENRKTSSPFNAAQVEQLKAFCDATKTGEKQGMLEKELQEDKVQVKLASPTTTATAIAAAAELDPSTNDMQVFMDILLKDLQGDEPQAKEDAKRMLQEILGSDDPNVKTLAKQKEPTLQQTTTPRTMNQALYCATVAGNVVRPKVKWHQTLTQIELIFEQQVPQYELNHRGNVLVYQALEAIPPQCCILNLLGEVFILSERQHGYQLHVKLAKQGLITYWPTLLSSLNAQKNSHWLVYDAERGESPQPNTGCLKRLCNENIVDPSSMDSDTDSHYSADELDEENDFSS